MTQMSGHSGTVLAIIDGGTTNIRVSLTEDALVLAKGHARVGAKDRVVQKAEDVMVYGIRTALEASLKGCVDSRLDLGDIDYGIALGMLTSNVGLLDLEHLPAPAGVEELARGLVLKSFPELLPCPIVFIRGVKNALHSRKNKDALLHMDTMRSEETQTMGIIDLLPELSLPTLITFLTSHTKYVRVDEEGRITASLTTMSGQIFNAIKRQTYLTRYIPEDSMIRLEEISQDDFWAGIEAEREMGFLRAIHMPRFMDVVLNASMARCYAYLLGALIGSDLRSFHYLREVMPVDYQSLVFIGNNNRPQLYREVFKRIAGDDKLIYALDGERLEEAVVRGAVKIFQQAQRLGWIQPD